MASQQNSCATSKKNKPAKYAIIKQYIRENIESGQWLESAKVPSENELTSQFNVSRMTARRALQELTEQGVLHRIQGAGTFVANFTSQSTLVEINDIKDEVIARGNSYQIKQLSIALISVTETLIALFNLKNSNDIFYYEVLHCENGKVIQVEQRYVNASLAPKYLQQSFAETTPDEYLSSIIPFTQVSHKVTAILASTELCQHLNITTTTPCLQVKRYIRSNQGIVSIAIFTSSGDNYCIT